MENNLISWSVLIVLLAAGLYTAFVIRGEKDDALLSAIDLEFHGLIFKIPRWWTKTEQSQEHIRFERTDTRYDWSATFTILKDYSKETSLQNIYEEQAIKRGLVFDKDTSIIHSPLELQELYSQGIEALRVEGTATENSENRLYYDAIVIRSPYTDDTQTILYLESRASVLNGLLEGPFFEQMLKHIKKAPQ